MNIHTQMTTACLDHASAEVRKRRPWLARQHLLGAWRLAAFIPTSDSAEIVATAARMLDILVRKAIVESQRRDFGARVHEQIERVLNRRRA